MKKRIVSMMLAAMVALSVVGCGSKTLSNDYVTVKQYKGLEVAQVEKVEVTVTCHGGPNRCTRKRARMTCG